MNQIERLIASSETVSQEDLATINRLSQEFEAELASIGGRVDDLCTMFCDNIGMEGHLCNRSEEIRLLVKIA